MPGRGAWPTVLVAALLLGAALPASFAQERYRLGEKEDWQKQTNFAPDSPEGKLQAIRRLIAEEKPKEAKKAADHWIKEYPNHPLLVQAYLLRGDARVAGTNEYKALGDYEYVIRQFPGTDEYNTALDREYELARIYSAGRHRKFLGMRILSASGEAEELFIRVQERAPGSELGEKASMALGDHYFNRGEMVRASEAYDLFLQNYPRSQYRERIMLRLIQSNLARFKGPQFDGTGLIDAGSRIRQYQKEFPASAERIGGEALLVRIDESLALKTLGTAHWYRVRHEPVATVTMLQRVVHDHPQTAAARAAMEELAKMDAPVVDERAPRRHAATQAAEPPQSLKVPASEAQPQPPGHEPAEEPTP